MAAMVDVIREQCNVAPNDVDHLRALVGAWQLLSDLSFSDITLWVPDVAGEDFVAIAHARPSTAATANAGDPVGSRASGPHLVAVKSAWMWGHFTSSTGPLEARQWLDVSASPVRCEGRVVAVLSRQQIRGRDGDFSGLSRAYRDVADVLLRMVARGQYPTPGAPDAGRHGAPRVGDGLVLVGPDRALRFASPNGVAALRRLGLTTDPIGCSWPDTIADVTRRATLTDEGIALIGEGQTAWRCDVEAAGSTIALRSIPLWDNESWLGCVVLCRDITELRHHERELMSREATIREIHHRVKNNLQTVAALLRLQARRLPAGEAKQALDDAIGRIGTISRVNALLSEGLRDAVNFDRLLDGDLLAAAAWEGSVTISREGDVGVVDAQDALPLALVVYELVANAVEHGYRGGDGEVLIRAARSDDQLKLEVIDHGRGMAKGFIPGKSGLGTQIVSSFVEAMRGTIKWTSSKRRGTTASVAVYMRPVDIVLPVERSGAPV